MTEVLTATQPIRLKGRSFLALVLSPELPIDDWLTRLDDLAERSAGFFLQRPIVLDLDGLDIDRPQLRSLLDQLSDRGVRIMGIEGARASLLGPDMPPAMSGGRPASDFETPEAGAGKPGASARRPDYKPGRTVPSIIVTEPVRSGQSLMFEGDITVVGSVSSISATIHPVPAPAASPAASAASSLARIPACHSTGWCPDITTGLSVASPMRARSRASPARVVNASRHALGSGLSVIVVSGTVRL